MWVVHKLCVNRLCRQDLRGCLPACFFQRRVLVFSRFFETHLSSERHINTFPHYSQSHMWTIFHICTMLWTAVQFKNSLTLYYASFLRFEPAVPPQKIFLSQQTIEQKGGWRPLGCCLQTCSKPFIFFLADWIIYPLVSGVGKLRITDWNQSATQRIISHSPSLFIAIFDRTVWFYNITSLINYARQHLSQIHDTVSGNTFFEIMLLLHSN